MNCPDQAKLDKIFSPEITNDFFEAIFGDVDEGAYDIRLVCQNIADDSANLAFELIQRPGKCLVCSLTYGLPEVFKKHPLINLNGVAQKIAELLGWNKNIKWQIGATQEINPSLHIIPFIVSKD